MSMSSTRVDAARFMTLRLASSAFLMLGADAACGEPRGLIRRTLLQAVGAGYEEARTVWNAMIDQNIRPA